MYNVVLVVTVNVWKYCVFFFLKKMFFKRLLTLIGHWSLLFRLTKLLSFNLLVANKSSIVCVFLFRWSV